MFKRFFARKDKFFLELKEDAAKAVGQAVEQAEKAIEKTTETISQVVDSKTAEPAKEDKVAQGKADKAMALAAKAKDKKTSIKDKKTKGKTEAKPVEAKPAAAPTVSQNGKADPQEVAFASINPVMSTMSRRTPGPSLNTFKEMARQAKIPTRRG